MYSPLTRFFNPALAAREKEEREKREADDKKRLVALKTLRTDKGFQEYVIGYLEKRIELLSNIDNFPDGNLEKEMFGRKQRLQELKDFLVVINGK